jgi:hypothetical protein
MAIPMGNIQGMNVINQNPQVMATAFQNLLDIGSQPHRINVNQLRIISDDNTINHFDNMETALRVGTKFFDAVAYFLLPAAERPAVGHLGPFPRPEDRTGLFVTRRLFVLAFYMLTRGNLPRTDVADISAAVPAILRNVFNVNYSPNQLAISLGHVEIREFNHQWIRYINWDALSIVSRNRFGLGVAGYRLLSPFKTFPCEATVQNNQPVTVAQMQNAYNVARTLATLPYCWEIHPVTRDVNILQAFGPLNQNLENLMLACFSHALLTELDGNQTLFRYPVYNARARNYLTWDLAAVPGIVTPIFAQV